VDGAQEARRGRKLAAAWLCVTAATCRERASECAAVWRLAASVESLSVVRLDDCRGGANPQAIFA
jgi:hypothetical protein